MRKTGARRKSQPQTVFRNPLARLTPTSDENANRLAMRAYAALDMMTMTKLGGDKEAWRDLADVVNITETMARKCGLLSADALAYTAAANVAMKAAQERYKAGKSLRLDGPGIEAVRAVISIYDAALKLLTERQVEDAFVTTQREVQRLIRAGAEAISL
jgi:hypothetical protein